MSSHILSGSLSQKLAFKILQSRLKFEIHLSRAVSKKIHVPRLEKVVRRRFGPGGEVVPGELCPHTDGVALKRTCLDGH